MDPDDQYDAIVAQLEGAGFLTVTTMPHETIESCPSAHTTVATCRSSAADRARRGCLRQLADQVELPWPPAGWTHNGRTHDPVEANVDYMGS